MDGISEEDKPSKLEVFLEKTLGVFVFFVGFSPMLSIFLTNVAWVGMLVVWGGLILLRREQFHVIETPLDRPILAVLGVWFLSSLFGVDFKGSFPSIFSELRFGIFFLLVWCCKGRYVDLAFVGYLWGSLLAVLYGLGQYALWTWVWVDHMPDWFKQLPDRWRGYFSLYNMGRVHGAVHPLTFAETILPAFFLYLVNFLNAEVIKKRLFWLVATGATGLCLLLTQSRGPWLGAFLGVVVILIFHRKRHYALIPMLVFVVFMGFHPSTQERLQSLTQKNWDQSAQIRLSLWRDGAYVIREHFWTGVGPKHLKSVIERYRVERVGHSFNPYRREGDMHNVYIQYFAERGVFGLLTLLWLFGAVIYISYKSYRNRHHPVPESLALLAAFVSFPLLNLTERAFDDAEVAFVFWILAAVVLHWAYRVRHNEEYD